MSDAMTYTTDQADAVKDQRKANARAFAVHLKDNYIALCYVISSSENGIDSPTPLIKFFDDEGNRSSSDCFDQFETAISCFKTAFWSETSKRKKAYEDLQESEIKVEALHVKPHDANAHISNLSILLEGTRNLAGHSTFCLHVI